MGFGSPCIVSSGLLVQESKTLTFMEVGISWLKLSLSDLESYNLLSLFFFELFLNWWCFDWYHYSRSSDINQNTKILSIAIRSTPLLLWGSSKWRYFLGHWVRFNFAYYNFFLGKKTILKNHLIEFLETLSTPKRLENGTSAAIDTTTTNP